MNDQNYQSVLAVQMKNWEPLVFFPALAMERIPEYKQLMSQAQ